MSEGPQLLPTVYQLAGRPETYLCFRVTPLDGRFCLALVPDAEEQHPFDVVRVFADDPRLTAGEYGALLAGQGATG